MATSDERKLPMGDGLALLLVLGMLGLVVATATLLGTHRRRHVPSHRAET